ncbi:hypothetical protein GYMLUDRAFT_41277 [Collybiopsis luxurians FD-317 M1]|uniref:5'-deoxynucleotidase n=1 Tax=Collybiopsis luxurians FD-317 M1 TaxID=944289 RepID=A0A0D0BGH2_9AGAR|nr:hypothetical protein GYMLUDRAFT_41277 [Collybiopsis luxurians FD-317 M1]
MDAVASEAQSKSYTKTGDVSIDRLAFFHILERLKTQKRTGWLNHKIPNPESIADHMHRMAIFSLCTSDTELDVGKCVMLSVVHDLSEALVGDIAPSHGISKEEKHQLEAEAMRIFIHEMLHNSPAAQRIEALWKEYECRETPEAQFVKDLDRFEMATQAFEYERDLKTPRLQEFYESSIPFIEHPEVQGWGEDLLNERSRLFPTSAE